MEFWKKTCLLLCLFGLFKEFRPSETFVNRYLLGPVHNFTETQVISFATEWKLYLHATAIFKIGESGTRKTPVTHGNNTKNDNKINKSCKKSKTKNL